MALAEGCSAPLPDLGHPRIKARLRLPGVFRSLATSFVGSRCLGILTCTHGSLTKFFTRDRLCSTFLAHTHLSKIVAACAARTASQLSPRSARKTPLRRLAVNARNHSFRCNSSAPPRHIVPALARTRLASLDDAWRRSDSNRRPPGCKPGALPVELRPRARARLPTPRHSKILHRSVW